MATTLAWTSATAANTVNPISTIGLGSVSVTLTVAGSVTGGQVTFEVTNDGANWYPIVLDAAASSSQSTTSALTASSAWDGSIAGWDQFRVRLSTAITGAGKVTATVETGAVATGGGAGNSAGTVNSVTSGDSPPSIIVGGTVANPTVAVSYAPAFGVYKQEVDISLSGAQPGSPGSTFDNAPLINAWLAELPAGTKVLVGGNYGVKSRILLPHNEIWLEGTLPLGICGFFAIPTTPGGGDFADTELLSGINSAQGAWAAANVPSPYSVLMNQGTGKVANPGFVAADVQGDYFIPFVVDAVTLTTTLGVTAVTGLEAGTGTGRFNGCLIQELNGAGSTLYGSLATHITPGTQLVWTSGVGYTLSYVDILDATINVVVGDYYPGALAEGGPKTATADPDAGPSSAALSGTGRQASVLQFYAPTWDWNAVRYYRLYNFRLDFAGCQFGPDGTTPLGYFHFCHPQERTDVDFIVFANSGATWTNALNVASPYCVKITGNATFHTAGHYGLRQLIDYAAGNIKSMVYADGSNGNTLYGTVDDFVLQDSTTGPAGQILAKSYLGSPIVLNMIKNTTGVGYRGHHEGMVYSGQAAGCAQVKAVNCMRLRLQVDFHVSTISNISVPAIRQTTTVNLPPGNWQNGGVTDPTPWSAVQGNFGNTMWHNQGAKYASGINVVETQWSGAATPTSVIASTNTASGMPLELLQCDAGGTRYTQQNGTYVTGGNVGNYATITVNNGTFTVPANVSNVRVRVRGAGGGGGGGCISTTGFGGGGGGGAGYVTDVECAVAAGDVLKGSILGGGNGGAGTATAAGTAGSAGHATTLTDTTTSTVLAVGGPGSPGAAGSGTATAAGGGNITGAATGLYAGGGGTGGTATTAGGQSCQPTVCTVGGGGGGQEAGTTGGGGGSACGTYNVSTGAVVQVQPGGASGTSVTTSGIVGEAATVAGCGGGGGGAAFTGGTGGTGGVGANGLIEIWW